jgi:hypothetical protein
MMSVDQVIDRVFVYFIALWKYICEKYKYIMTKYLMSIFSSGMSVVGFCIQCYQLTSVFIILYTCGHFGLYNSKFLKLYFQNIQNFTSYVFCG